jgi:hypothetical protein
MLMASLLNTVVALIAENWNSSIVISNFRGMLLLDGIRIEKIFSNKICLGPGAF